MHNPRDNKKFNKMKAVLDEMEKSGVLKEVEIQEKTSKDTWRFQKSGSDSDDEQSEILGLGDAIMKHPASLIPSVSAASSYTASPPINPEFITKLNDQLTNKRLECIESNSKYLLNLNAGDKKEDLIRLAGEVSFLLYAVADKTISPDQIQVVYQTGKSFYVDVGAGDLYSNFKKKHINQQKNIVPFSTNLLSQTPTTPQAKTISVETQISENDHPFVERLRHGVYLKHLHIKDKRLKVTLNSEDFSIDKINKLYNSKDLYPKTFEEFVFTLCKSSPKRGFFLNNYRVLKPE
ncbi:putative phosphoprotein [Mononegavirales sp.]|nr:putative phosphoprotein [Mononegavirales sp.]